MNGFAIVGSVLGLGVAGLDPVGALMVMPAIAAGARRRIVMLFFLSAGIVTVATGMVLGQSMQAIVAGVERLAVPDLIRLVVQLVVAVALTAWAVRRWRRRGAPSTEKSLLTHPVSMIAAGAGWGVSAVTDPSFLALAVIESRFASPATSLAAYTGWFLISQLPLTVILIALAAGRKSPLVQWALRLARRIAAPMSTLLTGLLALSAIVLLLNAMTLLFIGRFWPV